MKARMASVRTAHFKETKKQSDLSDSQTSLPKVPKVDSRASEFEYNASPLWNTGYLHCFLSTQQIFIEC